jgi:proteasome alpha subunit
VPAPDSREAAPATSAHAPSVPEPGTPPGLGDPANPDTAGGADSGPQD